MQAALSDFPFDLVDQISCLLDLRSFISLSLVCKSIHTHLQNKATIKKCIQNNIHFVTGGKQGLLASGEADDYGLSYQSLLRKFQCKESIRTASPYSLTTIAYAKNFVFHENILCYSQDSKIRILSLRPNARDEKILSGGLFSSCIPKALRRGYKLPEEPNSIIVQSYARHIVTVLCEFRPLTGHFLFAVNIKDDFPSNTSPKHRVRLIAKLGSVNKLFVRHNDRYLYYGVHTTVSNHYHSIWVINGYDLLLGRSINRYPLYLSGLVGSEIGNNVAFTIHDNMFYGLTSQTSLETEEITWASYYHFIRFPLDDPEPELDVYEIYRRDHAEGPINDAWCDLHFEIDQQTDELLVVEGRKEWLKGCSTCERTYYTMAIEKEKYRLYDENEVTVNPTSQLRLARDECDHSRWEAQPRVRIPRYTHEEFRGVRVQDRREYLRTKTKWNGYSFNANSYIDLVSDEFIPEGQWRPKEKLRLRVVSRMEIDSALATRDECYDTPRMSVSPSRAGCWSVDSSEIREAEREYTSSEVYMWPPGQNAGGKTIQHLDMDRAMCPDFDAGEITAVLGDRMLIYMAGEANPEYSGNRALILISFDPSWGFESMRREDGSSVRQRQLKVEMSDRAEDGPPPLSPKPDTDHKRKHESDIGVEGMSNDTSDQTRTGPAQKKLKPEVLSSDEETASNTVSCLTTHPSPLPVLEEEWNWSNVDLAISSINSSNASTNVTKPQIPTTESIQTPSQPQSQTLVQSQREPVTQPQPNIRLIWKEKAKYLTINQGFWLR